MKDWGGGLALNRSTQLIVKIIEPQGGDLTVGSQNYPGKSENEGGNTNNVFPIRYRFTRLRYQEGAESGYPPSGYYRRK